MFDTTKIIENNMLNNFLNKEFLSAIPAWIVTIWLQVLPSATALVLIQFLSIIVACLTIVYTLLGIIKRLREINFKLINIFKRRIKRRK